MSFFDEAMQEASRSDAEAEADRQRIFSSYEPDARTLLGEELERIFDDASIGNIALLTASRSYEFNIHDHGYETFTFVFQFAYEDRLFQGTVFLNEREPRPDVNLVDHCRVAMKTLSRKDGTEEWKRVSSKMDIGRILLTEAGDKG